MGRPRILPLFLLNVIIAVSVSAAERMPLLMPGDFESLQLVAWRVEVGVADPHNPLLEPAMSWDSGGIMAHGTVLRDPMDWLWKAWQVSTPVEAAQPARSGPFEEPDPDAPACVDALAFNHMSERRQVVVSWKGGEKAPAEAVKIRFVLRRAFLYRYDWEDRQFFTSIRQFFTKPL